MTEKLSERVERLEGPDREIDRAIKQAFDHDWDYSADWDYWDALKGKRVSKPVAKPYTASLDVAMSLARNDEEAFAILADAMTALENDGWPRGEWAKKLARYVAAQALKARGL